MLDAPSHPEVPWLRDLREQISMIKTPQSQGWMASLFS
jgi:hypothetical protein